MNKNRFLALLCMLSLLCMNFVTVAPSAAEAGEDRGGSSQAQTQLVSNKKKKKAKATKTPKPTKTPKATKKPKATKTPKPTKTPKATKKPKATEAPETTEGDEATEAPKATKKPKATKTPKPTEAPESTEGAEATEAPEATKKPKATKTPKPTKAPEEAEQTEAPEEPTQPEQTEAPEEPTQPEQTEAPEEPAQPEQTEAPEEPAQAEQTQAPEEPAQTTPPEAPEVSEETKAPEATEQPGDIEVPKPAKEPKLKLKGLKADKPEVEPGKKVKFTLTVENAEKVAWNAQRTDGVSGGAGKVKGGSFSWKPQASGVYTVTVNATTGDKTATDSCVVIVRSGKLEVAVEPDDYAQQGGKPLKYAINIKGGCEPYTMSTVVKYKGEKIFKSEELLDKVTLDALGYGENKLTVTVTDAMGETVKAKAKIVSASNERNQAPALPKLKEDMTFAEKLLAVAKSQQGYRESKENFILRDGGVQGWSYYGGWYGAPYDEWCAMFVSYCLVNAGITYEIMPNNGNCNNWKAALAERYIDDEDDYIPEPGDIIFFHHNRVSRDPNYPNHIGIVTRYDDASDTVYTVEGNSGKSVRARQYERSTNVIVGYVSMRECMVEHDEVFKAQLGDQLAANLEAFRTKFAGDN